jgi:hypothetical protein
MGFYQERVLPWLVHLSMGQRRLVPYRNRVVSDATGRVLEVGIGCRFRILDSCIPMVQAAKDRMRNNVSEALDWAHVGSVLPERNVSSPFVIVGSIFCKNSSKVLCVENYQMVKTFASDRPR